MNEETMKIIAHIHTDFPEKFGIPRQSGLVEELKAQIVFEPAYRLPDAFKGLEGFDYLWLLWKFEGTERTHWRSTVTPPRLGGKTTMGVFATRSPFRPNPIGLSSVKLERVEYTEHLGPILHVSGADLKDNTPIYDVKPYLAYTDSHPDAKEGFAAPVKDYGVQVDFPPELLDVFPKNKQEAVIKMLEQDPRPAYHNDDRLYGVSFAGYDIRFCVKDGVLSVNGVTKLDRLQKIK